VLHSPHYTIPLALTSVARVVTLHDLIFFLYPQYHSLPKLLFFRRMIRWASRAADHVITDSDATRADAIRLLRLPPERMTTVPLAADERFRPIDRGEALAAISRRHSIEGPFLLTVCTLEPRKNLVGAIRALRIVRQRGRDVRLVIAGARGWRVAPVFEEVSRQGLEGQVRFLGHVPDDDLALLYSACEVFLYPSMYEGFGLPPLEAMACGSAVVVSDRSSMPEVVGDAGLLCDPANPEDIAAKALVVLEDAESATTYRERALARSSQFSWGKTARLTHEIYQRVLAHRRSRSNIVAAGRGDGAALLGATVTGGLVAGRALRGALLHGLLKLRGLLLLPVLARALGPSGMGVLTLGAPSAACSHPC